MKKIVLTLSIAWMATACVMTPDAGLYPAPNVEVGVGVNSGDFNPRIYNGTRSSVSVWLHPTYTVADAYPIAQAHCSRWGFYARPSYDWIVSTSFERRLNYSCVSYRPVLSGPHIIIGSPFYRNHYSHWHNGRRYGNRHPRRGTFGRGHIRNNGRTNNRRSGRGTVYTPKPTPRHVVPSRKRGTFGRVINPTTPAPRDTTVQRGKPWEHNKSKNKVVSPRPDTTIQRGKPWEHNRNKGTVTTPTVTPRFKSKRSTFGSSRSMSPRGSFKSKSNFGGIRPKTSSRRSSKGKLRL